MRKLMLLCSLMLSGCVTSKAVFVQKSYSPKSGSVRLAWSALGSEDAAREKAMGEIQSFCSPNLPTLVGEHMDDVGAKAHNGVAQIIQRPVIDFRCD